MIPFFQYNSIILGPIVIQVWGLYVALGIIAGVLLSLKLAKKLFLSDPVILDLTIWILIGAFFFARIFHIVFYNLDYYFLNPIDVLKFWQGGASSFGGFFGALVAVWLFAKKRSFSWPEMLPYFDVMTPGFWLGWGIGRIGCFFIHDHPGKLSNFFLAVRFPEGSRLDLGLLDSILGFVIFALVTLAFKKLVKTSWGLLATLSLMFYAAVRFFFDFLRATDVPQADVRYAHLTPAQWGMIAIFLTLTFLLISSKVSRSKDDGRVA